MNKQLIHDLKASKAELERRGWVKGSLIDNAGRVCTIGAIACAFNYLSCSQILENPRAAAVAEAIARLIDPARRDDMDTIMHKNDDSKTTAQDIYDLFDKALAEAGGLA